MRLVTVKQKVETLVIDEARRVALEGYVLQEIEDALSARQPQEMVWRNDLRAYDGVPTNPVRNVPIENAPNIEVTLGAIATDAVYAQAIDLIFNISPPITARSVPQEREAVNAVKALQRYINWGVANEWDLRIAADETVLDNVKLGTGVYHIPFVEEIRKTQSRTVITRGPRILTVPIEDFLVPGGAYDDLQKARWVAHRFWYTEQELADQADAQGWDTTTVQPAGATDWVRSRREMLGRTLTSVIVTVLYEIFMIYCYFDIDDDGMLEDLIVVWDRTSHTILDITYNRYDRRPFEASRYQIRGHLFYGLGVMDMVRPYQEECTELHNYAMLNSLLANSRLWKAKSGSVPESMAIWPGKVVEMNDPDDLEPLAMADIYPSIGALQAFPIAMAERRVGINDLSTPRPSAVLGSRTPGITALSLLQQTNRRFTPAFDGVRLATANAIKQCLYRMQEQLLSGDKGIERHVEQVLGVQDGRAVIRLLRNPDFDHAVEVELTASSATINRDVERQNALLLINVLAQYYDKTLNLVAIASNPQTPPAVKDVAKKIAASAGELIERTLRTFDQVRDPMAFIVDINAELDATPDIAQQGLQGLMQMLTQGGGGANGGGAKPLVGLPGALG